MVRRWPLRMHFLAAVGIAAATALNGWLMDRYTDAQAPYLDAFVTWSSVVTTWMVARRLLENWLYWVVVDSVAAYLYFSQQLYPTTVLFVLYVGIVIRGHFVWLRQAATQVAPTVAIEPAKTS